MFFARKEGAPRRSALATSRARAVRLSSASIPQSDRFNLPVLFAPERLLFPTLLLALPLYRRLLGPPPPRHSRIGARHADPRRQQRHVVLRPARSSSPLPRAGACCAVPGWTTTGGPILRLLAAAEHAHLAGCRAAWVLLGAFRIVAFTIPVIAPFTINLGNSLTRINKSLLKFSN
jgi:hypothetical protein